MLMFVNGRLAKVEYIAESPFTPGSFAEALSRARNEGIRILTAGSGLQYATSSKDPSVLYDISIAGGCGCPAFENHGKCKHYALFLSTLGVSGQHVLGQVI